MQSKEKQNFFSINDLSNSSENLVSEENEIISAGKTNVKRSFIVVCVISAVRTEASYLITTLESLRADMPTVPPNVSMHVNVIDASNSPQREDMRAARLQFPNFTFEPLLNKTHEPCTPLERRSDSNGTTGAPPCSVRQQTRDVLAALPQCARRAAGAGWVLLVEDDTEACPAALATAAVTLRAMADYMAAGAPGAWRLAAFSSYFSGVALPAAALPAFLPHAWARLAHEPVDHLIWGPWAGGALFKFQGNLFRHVGRVSAFEYRNGEEFRRRHDRDRFSPRQAGCFSEPVDRLRRLALHLPLRD